MRIEGVRPVLEAIRAGRRRVHRVLVSPGDGSPGLRTLESEVRARGIEITRRRVPGLRAVAEVDPLPELPFEALLMAPPPRFLVALDRVTDVGNVGSIARSAEVAGVTGLALEHRNAPPIEPGALRASAGALEYLPVGRTSRLGASLDLASTEGLRILVADPGGGPLDGLDPALLRGELVVVFGSEDRGLRSSIRERADLRIGIPLAGRVASLGVAAAAAYLLLRIAEARRGVGGGG